MYLNHCEQHESIHQLRTAIIEVRKISTAITKRRERENAERATLYQQQPQQMAESTASETERNSKRKRGSDVGFIEQSSKKIKADEAPAEFSSSAVLPAKRDREHAIVIVKKLPPDTAVKDVRQFFMDCGTILDIKLVKEGDYQRATVEFETEREALFAQSRTSKPFKGHKIEIDLATGTTLWVANYPPTADEQYIRNLFKKVSGL
jgi:RNA recognition motif-containing protein